MATSLLLKYRFDDLQVNPVSCVSTERNLRLQTVLGGSVGETPIACIDELSPVSSGCEVFPCHRQHQLLTRLYQSKMSRLAFLNEAAVRGLVEALSVPLFRITACYHVGKLLLFLWAECRVLFNPPFQLAKNALVLALVHRRFFHFEPPDPY